LKSFCIKIPETKTLSSNSLVAREPTIFAVFSPLKMSLTVSQFLGVKIATFKNDHSHVAAHKDYGWVLIVVIISILSLELWSFRA